MSLVSEALKKAEREAAAREARERGQPGPLESPRQPYRAPRRRRGTRGGSAVALAIAAGVVIVFLVLFATRSTSNGIAAHGEEAVASSAPTSPVDPPSAPTPATPTDARSPAETPATAKSRETTSASAPARVSDGTEGAEGSEEAKPAVVQEFARSDRPAPPSKLETARANPGLQREFVRRIDFPDGSKLELGGIAYSESAPFAYLNGRLLKIGETAAGYTLVAIERDHVVVRGPMGELTIRSRPR